VTLHPIAGGLEAELVAAADEGILEHVIEEAKVHRVLAVVVGAHPEAGGLDVLAVLEADHEADDLVRGVSRRKHVDARIEVGEPLEVGAGMRLPPHSRALKEREVAAVESVGVLARRRQSLEAMTRVLEAADVAADAGAVAGREKRKVVLEGPRLEPHHRVGEARERHEAGVDEGQKAGVLRVEVGDDHGVERLLLRHRARARGERREIVDDVEEMGLVIALEGRPDEEARGHHERARHRGRGGEEPAPEPGKEWLANVEGRFEGGDGEAALVDVEARMRSLQVLDVAGGIEQGGRAVRHRSAE